MLEFVFSGVGREGAQGYDCESEVCTTMSSLSYRCQCEYCRVHIVMIAQEKAG